MGRFRNVCISKWSFSCFWRFDILACSTHRCRWLGICQGDTCILGEERWLPRFPTHRRRWLCEKRRDVRVIFNDKFSWWIQPTDVGDFGGIRSVEGAATHATHRHRWLWEGTTRFINPTNTFFFCHFHEIFSQTYFFWLFAGKKALGCRVNWQEIFLRISEIYVIFKVTGAGDFA